MSMRSRTTLSLFCGTVLLVTGCASTSPIPYARLDSAPHLQPNARKDADRTPYIYSSTANWRSYSALIIEPVSFYADADARSGDLEVADKEELAQYMRTRFSEVLGERFRLSSSIGPGTLRLKLTLIGAEKNTAVVSTFTRFDLVGLPVNAVQGIRGKEGIFMGSVTYSVEIFDAQSNRLLKALVTKQFPNAMNIAATFGSLSAAKTGIDNGAEQLMSELR